MTDFEALKYLRVVDESKNTGQGLAEKIKVVKESGWILHLIHECHSESSNAYLLISNKHDYTYIYRVVARLQHTHSESDYKTEDLSGKQVAFLLNKLLTISILSDERATDFIDSGIKLKELDLFWNWEQGVVKFGFDEDSRVKGGVPYFYPDVVFSDYAIDGTISAFLDMDKHI